MRATLALLVGLAAVSTPALAQGVPTAKSVSMFVSPQATDVMSSNLIGLSVYNNDNKDIGTIKDIAVSSGRLQAYVLSVGGFLGMGDRYVAVSPQNIRISYDPNKKKWDARMNASADQLKAAPQFQYTGRLNQ